MDNSIEVFNCPLCSFCETGLDRLVKHIRQHIKPEPRPISQLDVVTTDDSPILPRDQEESNQQKENRLDGYITNLSSKDNPPAPVTNLFSSTNNDGDDEDLTSPKIGEVQSLTEPKKPESTPSESQHPKPPSTQQPQIQLTALPNDLPTPHMLNAEVQPMLHPMQISPPGN